MSPIDNGASLKRSLSLYRYFVSYVIIYVTFVRGRFSTRSHFVCNLDCFISHFVAPFISLKAEKDKLEQDCSSLQVKLEAAAKRHKRELEDVEARANKVANDEFQVGVAAGEF